MIIFTAQPFQVLSLLLTLKSFDRCLIIAFVVYKQFSELVCLLLLVLSYRMIIELLHVTPGVSYSEFFGLAFTTGIYFVLKDFTIAMGFMIIDSRLLKRHMTHIACIVDWITTISLFVSLGVMYSEQNIYGHNYYGLVAGLLWWKLIYHLKGMVC